MGFKATKIHVPQLSDGQLQDLWYILVECSSLPSRDKLNYEDFSQAAAQCLDYFGSELQPYFRAAAFLSLPRDGAGMITCASLFGYIMRRNSMLEMRQKLETYDEVGMGWLSDANLQQVIRSMLPTLEAVCTITIPQDVDMYCQFVAARFRFFLGCKNRMKIGHFLLSFALADMLELKLPSQSIQPTNTMSAAAFAEVFAQFSALDTDCSHWLTEAQLSGYNGGTLTPLCISRLFELHGQPATSQVGAPASGLHIDFPSFTEFMTAWTHRHLPSGCNYFFQFLDLQGNNYLTQEDLYVFLKSMQDTWVSFGHPPEPPIADLMCELLDIIRPTNPARICLHDMMACGMAGIVIGVLLDVQLFWEYDSREELLQSISE